MLISCIFRLPDSPIRRDAGTVAVPEHLSNHVRGSNAHFQRILENVPSFGLPH